MIFSNKCSICKEPKGVKRLFRLKPQDPHAEVRMITMICDNCMASDPETAETIEDYLKVIYGMKKVTYVQEVLDYQYDLQWEEEI